MNSVHDAFLCPTSTCCWLFTGNHKTGAWDLQNCRKNCNDYDSLSCHDSNGQWCFFEPSPTSLTPKSLYMIPLCRELNIEIIPNVSCIPQSSMSLNNLVCNCIALRALRRLGITS